MSARSKSVDIRYSQKMDCPAHQFICIPELYELLLAQLALERDSRYRQESLARLARASRITSGPALDLLWQNLTRPSQIIRLLPEDAIQRIRLREYRLVRSLEDSDLAVFDKYAPRVQFVDFSNNFINLGAGCEFFSTLKMLRDPIFPRLLELEWHPSVRYNTVGAFHLISRRFNVPRDEFSLTLWGNLNARDAAPTSSQFLTGAGLDETIDLFQRPLASWLPDIPGLSINTGNYLTKPAMLEGLQSLSNLQHFHARASGSLGAEIIVHLAFLPHLKTLHIGNEEERSITVLCETVTTRGPPSFPALESVEIYGSYSALNSFLGVITSNFLHSAYRTVAEVERRALFTMATFEPLLACTNLETFDLNVDACDVDFGDRDLKKIANAWPRLTSLKVFSRYTQQYNWSDPQVHLYTLWVLVEKCRDLRRLEIAVDARVDGPFVPPPGGAVSGLYAMDKLGFFLSPCGAPTHVANFLNLAFPHLTEFFAGAPKEETVGYSTEVWTQVRDALPGVDPIWRALRLAHAPSVQFEVA
ncbi:hypothetical protein B0H14DRAFT_2699968 [Mycena olivaceomarginata]|nr:hypothetical protein B0H14DRAFT_2699968 [Mycena olivaceomarginata]